MTEAERREKSREYTRNWKARNREKVLAADRAKKAAIPIEVKRAKNAAWRASVSEEWRQRKRAYNRERLARIVAADPDYWAKRRMADLEANRARGKARYERDRVRRIALATKHAELRRVRLSGGKTFQVTKRDWQRLVARYEGRCAYCGIRPEQIHREHVFPVARGGHHSIGNLLPACGPCNRSKGKRTIVEWRQRQRMGLAA